MANSLETSAIKGQKIHDQGKLEKTLFQLMVVGG